MTLFHLMGVSNATYLLQGFVDRAADKLLYTLYWSLAKLLWQLERMILSGALLINGLRQWLVDNALQLLTFMINGIAPIAAALLLLAIALLGLQLAGSRVLKTLPQWINPERLILMAVLSVLFLGTPELAINALEEVRNMVMSIRAGESLDTAATAFDTGTSGTPDEPLPNNIPDVLAVDPFAGVVDAFDLTAYYIQVDNVAVLDETTLPPAFEATWFPNGEPAAFDLASESEREEALRLAADGNLRLFFGLISSGVVIAEQMLYLMLQAAAVILYLGLPLAFALSYFVFTQSLLTQYIRQFINLLLETLWSMIVAGFAIWLMITGGSYGVMFFFFAAIMAAILLYWRVVSAGLLIMRGFSLLDGSSMTGGAGVKTLTGIARGGAGLAAGAVLGAANRVDDTLKTTAQVGAAGGLYAAGRYRTAQANRTVSPVRRQQAIQRGQQLQAAAGYVAGRNERIGQFIEGAHEVRTLTRRVRGNGNAAADGFDYLRVGQMQSADKSNPWLSIGMSHGLQEAYQQLGATGGGRRVSTTDPERRFATNGENGATTHRSGHAPTQQPTPTTEESVTLQGITDATATPLPENDGARSSLSPPVPQPASNQRRDAAETAPSADGSQQRMTPATDSVTPNPIPQLDIAAVRSVLEPDVTQTINTAETSDSSQMVREQQPVGSQSSTPSELQHNPFMPDDEARPSMADSEVRDPLSWPNLSGEQVEDAPRTSEPPVTAEQSLSQSAENPPRQTVASSVFTSQPTTETIPPRSVPQAIALLDNADPAVRTQAHAHIAATAGTKTARQIAALTDKYGQPAVQQTTQRLTNWLSQRQQQGAGSTAILRDLQRGAAWTDNTPLSLAEQATLAQAIVQPTETVDRQQLTRAALAARAAGYDSSATAAWLGSRDTLPTPVTTQLNALNQSADALGLSQREVLAVQADVEQYGAATTQAALVAEGKDANTVSQLVMTLDALPTQTHITPDLRFARGDLRGYQAARGETRLPIRQGTTQIGDTRERATVLAQAVSGLNTQAAPAVQQMAQATISRLTSAEEGQDIQQMIQRVGSNQPVQAAIQRIGDVVTRYEREEGLSPAAVVARFTSPDGEGLRAIEHGLNDTPLKRVELQQLAAATLHPEVVLSRQELATAITQNAWQSDASSETLTERLQVTDFAQQTAAVRMAATQLAESGLEATTVQQVVRDMARDNLPAAHDRLQKTKLPHLQTQKARTALLATLQQLPATMRLRRRFTAPRRP